MIKLFHSQALGGVDGRCGSSHIDVLVGDTVGWWSFNKEARICEIGYFLKAGRNANKFDTKHECEAACANCANSFSNFGRWYVC